MIKHDQGFTLFAEDYQFNLEPDLKFEEFNNLLPKIRKIVEKEKETQYLPNIENGDSEITDEFEIDWSDESVQDPYQSAFFSNGSQFLSTNIAKAKKSFERVKCKVQNFPNAGLQACKAVYDRSPSKQKLFDTGASIYYATESKISSS